MQAKYEMMEDYTDKISEKNRNSKMGEKELSCG